LHLKDLEEAEIPYKNQTQINVANSQEVFKDFGQDLSDVIRAEKAKVVVSTGESEPSPAK